MTAPRPTDYLLAVGAALRATRFVTTDWLGHWWLVAPARKWAGKYEEAEISRRIGNERAQARRSPFVKPENHTWLLRDGRTVHDPTEFVLQDYDENEPWSKQAKLVKGLDCPFCVGFWIGVAALLSLAIARAVPSLLPAWRLAAGAFAMNYIVGHVSKHIDGD